MTNSPASSIENNVQKLPGLRILIAEDQVGSSQGMATLLNRSGYDVKVARNGRDAIQAAWVDGPDVLLLDLGHTGGSGYEVAKQLHNERPRKTPFLIAMTAPNQELDRRHSAEAGIDLHWVKPVDPDLLKAVLLRFQRVLHDRPADGPEEPPLP